MGWYGTARDAGERADDRSVMSWSRATVSRMSLFTGHPARALREARQTLAHGGAGAAVTLWAWDVEAQSLAALGRSQEALGMLERLITAYERWQPYLAADVYGFPEQQLHKSIAAVHAFAGDPSRAADAYGTAR